MPSTADALSRAPVASPKPKDIELNKLTEAFASSSTLTLPATDQGLEEIRDAQRLDKECVLSEKFAGQLQGASSSQTPQTSNRSTGETLENISGRQEDFDEKLTTVAQKVGKRDEIDKLGKALGFEPDDIQRYVDTNMKNPDVSYMGTLSMLRYWRKKQTRAIECKALKGVLRKAGQIHLADELFGT
ncbi:uncharacterized protein LOC105441805 [Strongylocentrotus purpuratus]|uniref:Death domain-containing protein n=1 Tax=Strongylocentrotus purpuratus TaxID=7668 RepID=A0A7M7SVH7_STRPU|nr:uncharacterized protein LOC105441805 [Strongylocentrotus purpuratus]